VRGYEKAREAQAAGEEEHIEPRCVVNTTHASETREGDRGGERERGTSPQPTVAESSLQSSSSPAPGTTAVRGTIGRKTGGSRAATGLQSLFYSKLCMVLALGLIISRVVAGPPARQVIRSSKSTASAATEPLRNSRWRPSTASPSTRRNPPSASSSQAGTAARQRPNTAQPSRYASASHRGSASGQPGSGDKALDEALARWAGQGHRGPYQTARTR
jgi:hypothetical protein